MRKKLLLAENSNLFAEVERKTTENEGLKIRLEDSRKTRQSLEQEKLELSNKLKASYDYINQLEQRVKDLEAEAEKMKSALLKATETAPSPIFEQPQEQEENTPYISKTDESIKTVIEEISCYDAPCDPEVPLKKSLSAEQREALRTKGAEEIGRVTKAVALATAKLQTNPGEESDRLYSLALGSNESFKIQVLSIVEAEGDFDELCDELHQKASSVIEKLKNL